VDFRELSQFPALSETYYFLAHIARHVGFGDCRVALVGPGTEVGYGVARQTATLLTNYGVEAQAYKEPLEARQWLSTSEAQAARAHNG
jgi:hypothetical protein